MENVWYTRKKRVETEVVEKGVKRRVIKTPNDREKNNKRREAATNRKVKGRDQ
ncbi:hypothetical protein [Salipaludibacillus sp. CF4.18]|uniref:hypothetical protein n=1 Tax=Salipaludibacillus sp. CF4.18 TaxID=3373081 RepID=UPI003EE43004